jgi:ubiquinone/menaquinone biosynthesis C-methylase UbiE
VTGVSDKAGSDHWSLYWAGGALTSLPQDFSANYDGEIQQFWARQFATVPAGGRILDVCTGNGAIALLAADATRSLERAPEILAVDAAAINPAGVAERFPERQAAIRAIDFIDRTPFEDLDLEAGSVDLIASQYGIEYCDLDRAAAKVFELLRTGGRMAMVCHSVSSDMLKTMEAEHRDYRQLDRSRLFERVEAFLAGELTAAQFRRALGHVRAELTGDASVKDKPLLNYAMSMLEGTLSMSEAAIDQARPRYRDFVRQLTSGRDRLADMLRVNKMIRADAQWFEVFERAGLQRVDDGHLHYQGRHDVGRFVIMQKP